MFLSLMVAFFLFLHLFLLFCIPFERVIYKFLLLFFVNTKQLSLLFFLFITSFNALVFELVWTRKLSLIFGSHALAVSTVLTLFMFGLALGSLYGGRWIEKQSTPYRFLAFVQFGIGATSLFTLFLFPLVSWMYGPLFSILGEVNILFNVITFLLHALILVPPTFLIGAVFPIVVKLFHAEHGDVGTTVGTCYFIDTWGSALGVLFVGFFSLWRYGIFKTSLFAAALNVLVGTILFFWFRNNTINTIDANPSGSSYSHQPGDKPQIQDLRVLVLFFFSGFAALTLENVWIRSFGLAYGNSVVSFSLVVASFLFGLGLGGYLSPLFLRRFTNKVLLFASIEFFIGLFSFLTILILPYLEHTFLFTFFSVETYTGFLLLLGIASFFVLIIPTTLMGMTLPVLSAIYAPHGRSVGADVGRLFGINSFGSILGSLLTGFVLMYYLSLNNTIILASLIYLTIGVLFVLFYDRRSLRLAIAVFALFLAVVIILFAFFYQPNYFYNGSYYHGARRANSSAYFEDKNDYSLLFAKQSPYSLVSVATASGRTYVKINGRTEASTGDSTQSLLAHLPLLFHPSPSSVLNVGHGGGYTLGTALLYPDVQSVDDVEIDKVIIEAGDYIYDNGNPLSDPRVHLIIADGRNYLFSTQKKYDIILTESSHIWACSSLFTKEFYEIVKQRLHDGGIYSIWLPYYEMDDYDYAVIMNTISSVFGHVAEFDFGNDLIILASEHEITVPDDIILSKLEDTDAGNDFYSAKEAEDEADIEDAEFIEKHYFGDVRGYLQTKVGNVTELNTDDRPILEFRTFRDIYVKFRDGATNSSG